VDSKTRVQKSVDDIRYCQTRRDELLKELEGTKQDIRSVTEWAQLVLKGRDLRWR